MQAKIKGKKIIFAITKSNWGGAQRYVYDLATHLKTDNEVIVISGVSGMLTDSLNKQSIRTIIIPELARDVNFLKEIMVLFRLWSFLRKEHPDIFHVNSSKMGGLGAFSARCARIPSVIFTAHGWAHKEERKFLSRVSIFFMHFMTVLLSHKTIAVSKEVKNQMDYFLLNKKLHIIHNGTCPPLFKKSAEARAYMLNGKTLPDKTVWVGTIAELHKNKGLLYAVNALQKLPTYVSFFIIGDGEDKEKLEQLAKENELSERIFFLGHVKDAASYLKAFDIFLVSSIKEGFPYALLEAGHAKLPVIATHVGGISEIINDLETGLLIQPRRSVEIESAIQFYLDNPHKMKEFSKNLYEKVIKEFSIEKMLKETENLYLS